MASEPNVPGKNEIVVIEDKPAPSDFLAPAVTVERALEVYKAKKTLIEQIFVEGRDFGKVPGSNSKPTLLKAGAEKAMSFFGLTAVLDHVTIVEDWTGENHGGEPFLFYEERCRISRGDRLIASANGSCNSWETKYRYRRAERICPVCHRPTIIKGKEEYGGGWLCYRNKGGCGAKFSDGDQVIEGQSIGQIKNPNPADVANTILKMADKRALVAASLIACGLSDYFTQDVEDFDGAGMNDVMDGEVRAGPGPEDIDQSTGKASSPKVMIPPLGEWAVGRYADAFKLSMQEASDAIKKALGKGGADPKPMTKEEFENFIKYVQHSNDVEAKKGNKSK